MENDGELLLSDKSHNKKKGLKQIKLLYVLAKRNQVRLQLIGKYQMHHIQLIRGKLHFIRKLLHRSVADCNFKRIFVFRRRGSEQLTWLDRTLGQLEEFPLHQSPAQCCAYARKFPESDFWDFVYHDYIAVVAQICVYGEKDKNFRPVVWSGVAK